MSTIEQYVEHQARAFRGDLVRARIIAGLSRAEVAERMGTVKRAVRRFEEGRDDVRLSFVRRYALSVGVLIQYDVVDLAEQAPGRHAAQGPDDV